MSCQRKIKDFTPKKDDESKECKKKEVSERSFVQRYVENNILSSIEF